MKHIGIIPVVLLFALSFAAQSPIPDKAVVSSDRRTEMVELTSRLMGRKVPYDVVLPRDYHDGRSSGRRYPVVYLLHGLTGRFDNWTGKSGLVKYAGYYSVIVVTPEGGNGWYTDNLTKDGDKYESYIVRELIPEVDRRYRTMAARDSRAIGGLSMGGFGAIKFGLKYPDMFSLAGSFSGALNAASLSEKSIPGAIGKTIDAIFGPAGSEIRKANDPFDMIRRATPEKIKTYPFLYVDCGTEDFLFQTNRDFAELLLQKNVPHEFRQLPGGHNWKYWDKQVEEFLEVAASHLNIGPALQ